jgi:predicted glycosyltransferase/peptidoglycan/xylan/chitin deacetylase (PgdA/CDA1 family)
MNLLTSYYYIKPMLPRRLQILSRRLIARYKQKAIKNIWPIQPGAAWIPEGWGGWPGHKKFAVILSHDVDTAKGRDRSKALMEMEKELDFKSAFNFVAQDYQVPSVLLQDLRDAGFEIGLHGLRHDGKLFSAKKIFYDSIPRINHYLIKWGAVGFHSPSTHRNLDWIVDLNLEYDSSTFDTDPFEPQPDGMNTIFPFWITNKTKTRGYVEFPYTLPQDHCLFVILQENDITIWKNKLDWIADKGGMVFLNTHPDYMKFGGGRCSLEEYPSGFYRELLEYVQDKYAGQYWNALPREVARFWKSSMVDVINDYTARGVPGCKPAPKPTGIKIWIDLDNTPHVPFFMPIIRELERRGHQLILTARDAFQVCELADEKGLPYIKIGRHYGKNPILKVFGLWWRSIQLGVFFLQHRPDVALSHGSRSQVLYCNLMRIPSILIADYEHAQTIPFAHARWSIVPDILPTVGLSSADDRIRHYRGIKEDVYVPTFVPDPGLIRDLNLSPKEIIIAVRPPADEAHYSNPESSLLLFELMKRISHTPGVQAVLLPRNDHQEHLFRSNHPEWFEANRTVVPPRAIDGLNLLWFSDLVVSGGGTMNREAAALGVPVYSIFRGKKGNVDRMLEREGRLVMIQNPEEVWKKIRFASRKKPVVADLMPQPALQDIISHIEDIIRIEQERSRRPR